MTDYELYSIIIMTIGFLAASIGIFVSLKHLKKAAESIKNMAEANSISTLNTVLSLEDSISEKRVRLSELAMNISQLKIKSNNSKSSLKEEFKIAELQLDEARESYLNSFDRLCACILRGFIPESEYRKDYRGGVNDVMTGNKDKLGPDTRFRNIVKIYNRWADQ